MSSQNQSVFQKYVPPSNSRLDLANDRVVGTTWGTGVLALLYRHLGEASRGEVAGIAGCTYLLQVNELCFYFVAIIITLFKDIINQTNYLFFM